MMARLTHYGNAIGSAPHADQDARQPIRTAQDFTAAMLAGARELYRDDALRRKIAERIS